jgi:2-hydroxy-6-oxonona-2,4-dienedioate hydrolase
LVLNTAGGSQADPDVMKRIITLSMAAAENPTWETVQARIKWLMADKAKDYDDIVASRQRVYRQPGFVGAMKDIMALQDPEVRARNLLGPAEYGAITAPTLVVWTSDDPTADVAEGRRMASMIPGARFEVMPGCGHWPQYEDPKTFNSLHLDFLLDR